MAFLFDMYPDYCSLYFLKVFMTLFGVTYFASMITYTCSLNEIFEPVYVFVIYGVFTNVLIYAWRVDNLLPTTSIVFCAFLCVLYLLFICVTIPNIDPGRWLRNFDEPRGSRPEEFFLQIAYALPWAMIFFNGFGAGFLLCNEIEEPGASMPRVMSWYVLSSSRCRE